MAGKSTRKSGNGTRNFLKLSKLIVDANVVIAAVLRNSTTRSLLLDWKIGLAAPQTLLEETFRNIRENEEIKAKSGLSSSQLTALLNRVTANNEIIQAKYYADTMSLARTLCVHEQDAPYIALSLKLDCPIWTNDNNLLRNKELKTVSTKELIEQIALETK